MTQRTLQLAVVAALLLTFPAAAMAHPGGSHAPGFATGLAHPLSGLDHLLAIVAVGLWAGQRGGKAVWLVPLTFLAAMTLGGVLGAVAVPLPFVEQGILVSVLLLGAFVAAAAQLPLAASAGIAAVFALFHGHAHGSEMPAAAASAAYSLGFLAATAALVAVGVAVGAALQRAGAPRFVRFAGSAVAAGGVYLMLA
jgi:urease accessory protein